MSIELKQLLARLYQKYLKSGSVYPFLTWVQIQRTGTVHFNPFIQGCSGLELDQLLFQHSCGLM